ncbi:helix-turn-helix transcriptional regulator [Paenibacillus thiaminolyticus]|uniref:Helix-turn-helix domain-containing protein n=1 Tax=Paenibacillus thiaminolyticus TaxID=49283 RepID=A0AAP9DXA5_PANTH|nr:helix-turn-helix transcriptional regulator [Paenibacillus thiaminolyticus]MCY9536686.1 helix-turn-helix transcriptional regulator [Paenibacillus thiaminolyticus]MCY9601979.1 helix-turn-helix transcriptional regulator [Paenibacillus thiaminolyticus]MCY9609862.1 helix-turn-helix transcriptional regulator [Paenibacillus thiaminolyticus]MCY9613806.1 helix-turn-helix transcriptional regulator [Paenibacillus thiaminolyticus]MCY9620708.1 helix-turn-helix transcriptional regulator [Paenibacillus th
MNSPTRLQMLSEFLRAKRAQILPQSVGLPAGTRRRTPGLRREEVAQLAGVSTTWYTWLEQGRDIQVSASVLDSIAEALKLTVDERKYLYALALEGGAGPALREEEEPQISPALQRILQELRHCPTIVSDRRCHIVGWNEAASHVFLDFTVIPPEERNMIRLLFTRKEFQSLAVNWEHFVKGFLSIFRAYYGQYVEDGWYDRFLEEMKEVHPDFQRLWNQSQVSTAPEVVIEFRHARAGKMLFHLTSLQVQGDADLRCSIYTPAPESSTEFKLVKLMDR